MRIVVLGGFAMSLANFRGPLIHELVQRGHEVVAAAPELRGKHADAVTALGARPVSVPLHRAGTNPLRDLASLIALTRLLRRERPELLLAYTLKPVTYGLVAARLAGVPRRAAMITGLGWAFGARAGWRGRVAKGLLRLALPQAQVVLFQNPDDRDAFARLQLVDAARSRVVNGSGVDLERFAPAPLPDGPVTFLLIARLLADKGIREYVAAAREVRRTHPEARFVLVGMPDPNPAAIPAAEVEAWRREGVVDVRDETDDVRPYLRACHVYVLPSYREGTPRTVLEAMATGRPIVTTDAPGCRETVEPGRTGLLVPVGDAGAVADAMRSFLDAPERIAAMGAASLALARSKYDVRMVNAAVLDHLGL